jgi:hypothetical protein
MHTSQPASLMCRELIEGNEPIHVHVRKACGFVKYWIEQVELDFSQGMKVNDLKIAEQLIIEHLGLIKSKWNEVHGC